VNNQEREAFLAYSHLPKFKRRVAEALETIREALKVARPVVSISWGKDSTVLLHLCQQVQPDILAVSFTHPERELISNYAEVQTQYKSCFGLNLREITIDGDHVPAKVAQQKIWEQYPLNFIGLRKEESNRRSISLVKYGLIHQYTNDSQSGSYRCCPIAWWGWRDVWAYTCLHNLPYLEIYDRLDRAKGRTTDHLSKTTNKAWQQRRLDELKRVAPEYFSYLQQNYPEMFFG
jgi:phosphoadenosine phosphosulfate reductase